MRTMILKTILIGLLGSLAACSEQDLALSTSSQTISGKIEGFASLSQNKLAQSISAQSCTSPHVSLYKLDENGDRISPAIGTVDLTNDGSYLFNLNGTSVSFANQAPVDPLVVILENCSEALIRPVTGKKNQDITQGTTLIAYLLNRPEKERLSENLQTKKDRMVSLISAVEYAGSLQLAYQALVNDASASAEFQSLFGVPPTALMQASPQVLTVNWPSNKNPAELSAISMSVTASHWSPTYTTAYIWKLDNTVISTNSSATYTLSGNSQGTRTLSLYVGQDDGVGGFDLTKPYQTFTSSITVQNNIQPIPLSFSVTTPASAGTSPINTRSLVLSMNTGNAMSNCATFSSLALTEESLLPPTAAEFTITCTQAFTQTMNYTLQSSGDGVKSLRLWAKDSFGDLSVVPTLVNVTLDTTNPVVAISSSPSNPSNLASPSFSFSATDLSSIDHYECDLDGGGFSTCSSPKSYSGLSAGSHTFSVKAVDAAGNTSAAVTHTWTIDLTAPTVAIATPAANGTFVPAADVSSYVVSGTCSENTRGVQISGSVSGAATCSAGSWAATLDISGLADGAVSITATHTDLAGNSTTTAARTFIKDTTAPSIAVTTPGSTKGNGNNGTVSWTLTEANVPTGASFSVDYYDGGAWVVAGSVSATTGTNSSQSYSLTNAPVPNVTTSAAKVRVSLTDASGNLTTAQSSNFMIDSTAPTLSNFTLNGGNSSTVSYNIFVSFQSQDSGIVQEYCLKYNQTSQPAANDSCWLTLSSISVTPSTNVTVTNATFRLGLIAGTYNLSLWAKDTVGNISTLTQTVGDDYGSVTYTPGNPPAMGLVSAANTDTPSDPVTQAELAAATGSTVFIKWSVSGGSLGATPIELYYTTDDSTWTQIGSAVANAQGTGCTISGSETGCYKWTNGSPTNNFFRIRAKVVDTQGFSSQANSLPLNVSSIRFLAGNTEVGINGSARTALFQNMMQTDPRAGDRSTLVVHPDGTQYFLDPYAGVLKISPTDGVVTKWLPKTGTITGNGGPVTLATAREPLVIALDYQNNLLLYDYNVIRKIDLSVSPPTISAFIGGGADSTLTSKAPSQLSLAAPGRTSKMHLSLFPLPNGDLIFRSVGMGAGGGPQVRLYKAATNTVEGFNLTGAAVPGFPSIEVSNCQIRSWVPVLNSSGQLEKILANYLVMPSVNSALCNKGDNTYYYHMAFFDLTGQYLENIPTPASDDGLQFYLGKNNEIYYYCKAMGTFRKFDKTAKNFTNINIAGRGKCADGTTFSSCKIDAHDFFIDSIGKYYFIDAGRIRTVADDGTVFTMAGSDYGYGDGLDPLLGRYGEIQTIQYWNDGTDDRVVVLDNFAHSLKEFSLASGSTQVHLAGNGTSGYQSTSSLAATEPITDVHGNLFNRSFGLDSSGNVYMGMSTSNVYRLKRSTGYWENFIGGGATPYNSGDGTVGTSIGSIYGFVRQVLAFGNGQILVPQAKNSNPNIIDPMLKAYDVTTGIQSHVVGAVGTFASNNTWCADGTPLSDCQVPSAHQGPKGALYDSATSSWLVAFGSDVIRKLTPGGNLATYYNPGVTFSGFALNRSAGGEILYFCDRSISPAKIKKVDMQTSTATYLSWPMSSISCAGYQGLLYHPTRNSLIFVYSQNGLYGVAEYLNP